MSVSLQTIVPTFPREVVPGLIWTGGCLSYDFEGDQIHSHMCSYLLIGSERTLLVDTGHPAHWPTIQATLDRYLDGRPLDYVFPTHSEMPHAGSLERLLTKYPGLEVVGDVRDYHLFFPSVADRFRPYKVGESVSLGDREFVFVDAIWRDLPNTLWAYDTGSRTLFPADGFAYTHHHLSHECALTSTERSVPDQRATVFINERALFWTRYVGVDRSFALIDDLFERYPVELVGPAHGNVIDDVGDMVPRLKQGMSVMKRAREDGSRPVVGY